MIGVKLRTLSMLLLLWVHTTQCLKILGVFPLQGKSHYILARGLMRGLAEKGHDVTVINPFGEKNPTTNGSYTDILLTQEGGLEAGRVRNLNLFQLNDLNFISYNFYMGFLGNLISESTLNHTNVQKMLKSNAKFDVVIVEQFINDALKGFAYHYKAPLVLFGTFASNPWVNSLVANPNPTSYIPEQFIDFNPHRFYDRFLNNVIYLFGEVYRNLLFFPQQNKILQKYFPGAPHIDQLLYNASLVLINSDLSTNQAVPRVPSMKDIGGFHLEPPKKLPQNLQEFLDNASEGVIYFSMGSALQSVNLPIEKRKAILKTFATLNQKVLWKWEDDVLPEQPSNVKLEKWLPQQDILAHPNIKLFITHGGLLSFLESVYHGVPLLAIPVYGDQVFNAAKAASNGCGRYILYQTLDENNFAEALNEILKNDSYRVNMKMKSKIMHDRQQFPIDEADYWINYVVRHNGAPHLRVAGLALTWYQYLSLDVYLVLIILITSVFYSVHKITKFLFRFLLQKPKKIKSN